MAKFLKKTNLSLSITCLLCALYAGIPFSFIWAKTTSSPLVIGFWEPVLTFFFIILVKPLFFLLKALHFNPGTSDATFPEPNTPGLAIISALCIMIFYLLGCAFAFLVKNDTIQRRTAKAINILTITFCCTFILTAAILTMQSKASIRCSKKCHEPEQQAVHDCQQQCQTNITQATRTPVDGPADDFNTCVTKCIVQNEVFRSCRDNCLSDK